MKLSTSIKSFAHELYKKIETKDHPLLYLFLEITRKCNMSCLHCGSDCKSEVLSDELSTESWIKIIDYVSESFGKDVAFVITGGEPLVHPDLEKIGKHICSKEMTWGIVTNGFALDKTRLSKLKNAGISSITLSFDGMKDSHNKLRNHQKAYTRSLNALKLIGESDIPLKDVVTCVYKDNIHQLDSVAETLIDHGLKNWRLFRIFPSGRAGSDNSLALSFDQTWNMLNWITTNRSKYKHRDLNVGASCEGWVPFDFDLGLRDFPFFCRAGINFASILSDGTITGCNNNHSTFHQGNIITDSLSDKWDNEFKDYRDKKWLSDTDCNDCEHLKKCKGGSMHLWKIGETKPAFCYIKENKS